MISRRSGRIKLRAAILSLKPLTHITAQGKPWIMPSSPRNAATEFGNTPSIKDFTLPAAEQGIGQTDLAALKTEFTLRQSAGAYDLLLAQPSVIPHINRELNREIQPGAQLQSKVAEKITLGNDPNARETIRSILRRGAFEVPSVNQESFTDSQSSTRYLEQENSSTPGSNHTNSLSDTAKSTRLTMDEIQQTALREVAVRQEAAQGLELLLAL